jgi:hypothetical protein
MDAKVVHFAMVQAIIPIIANLAVVPSLAAIVKGEQAIVLALHPISNQH